MNTPEDRIKAQNRVHTTYWDESGKRLPSVTTILNYVQIGSKPNSLKIWAYNLGRKGIDMDGYVDSLAAIGTLAHRMILDHLRGDTTDTSAYAPQQTDLAENCFLKYLEWERQRNIEPRIIEKPLTSKIHGFGGTPDFYGLIDSIPTLMDFKTGKGIYEDYWYQLGGYDLLIAEAVAQKDWPRRHIILNIGRSEDEKFIEEQRSDVSSGAQVFLNALGIYKLTRKRI